MEEVAARVRHIAAPFWSMIMQSSVSGFISTVSAPTGEAKTSEATIMRVRNDKSMCLPFCVSTLKRRNSGLKYIFWLACALVIGLTPFTWTQMGLGASVPAVIDTDEHVATPVPHR